MFKHLFLRSEILGKLIFTIQNGDKYFVQSTPRQQPRRALPEEIIRQLFVISLLQDYHYPEELIELEYPVQMGRERKRADIVIFDEKGGVNIVVEVKVEEDKYSMDQLRSYMAITGAEYGAVVSSNAMNCINMISAKKVEDITDIPVYGSVAIRQHANISNNLTSYRVSIKQSLESIGIEDFNRHTQTHAEIKIKGYVLKLTNIEIESYAKLRSKFLEIGVMLDPDVKQSEWRKLFSELFEKTTIKSPLNFEHYSSDEGKAKEAILKAINESRPGFSGGWVSSKAVTHLFNKINVTIPNNSYKKLLNSIGYIYHPRLRNGRVNNKINDFYGESKPRLYIIPDHSDSGLPANETARAYLTAQNKTKNN